MVDLVAPPHERLHDREKFLLYGATEAAIGKLIDVTIRLLVTSDGASAQDITVNAQLSEFIDDNGDTQPLGILQDMAQQGRFPATEKTRHNGGRNLGKIQWTFSLRYVAWLR